MAYRANPFLERMSERTTSDQDFVHLFSPKILEKLHEDCFKGAVHIFRSPPGGGKSTILRAFTPNSLRAFWNAGPNQAETYKLLIERGVLGEEDGPILLGVMLSCSSGYADLPPGASNASAELFRALLNCRIVMRTLRSLSEFLNNGLPDALDDVQLRYAADASGLRSIPLHDTAAAMMKWAEESERSVYEHLDILSSSRTQNPPPAHARLESVLWLQSVQFSYKGRDVASARLLMIDDVQALRKAQRALLIDELVTLRPSIPVWLASRTIAFGDEFLSQGARSGRDVREYALEELWGSGGNNRQFVSFAQSILDRRFQMQTVVPGQAFGQYLQENFPLNELNDAYIEARSLFDAFAARYKRNVRYSDWLANAAVGPPTPSLDAIISLYVTRILIARDEANKQLSFELAPLPAEELQERDSAATKGAAEIFLNFEQKFPYYYGLDRLCTLATNNVEELLSLAAALYEGMKAKQVLRQRASRELLPQEQEKRLQDAAASKRDFITRTHKDGTKAQRLLDSIGLFCRERTFQPNAPYAPGVTGVRLSNSELSKLERVQDQEKIGKLKKVLFECVAENLLVTRESAASTNREGGTVFYLNRTLCAHFSLPLQYGGWQETTIQKLSDWMDGGYQPAAKLSLGGR